MNANDPTGKFCYSLDGEWYRGQFDSRSSAAAQAETDIDDDCKDGEEREFYVAECCHPLDVIDCPQRAKWTGERIVEQIDEWCADEVAAEDWILDIDPDDVEELGKLVLSFVREKSSVQYYGIKNEEKRSYVAGSSEFNWEIAMHVRRSLLSLIAKEEWTTCEARPGMILTDWAEEERAEFHREHGDS